MLLKFQDGVVEVDRDLALKRCATLRLFAEAQDDLDEIEVPGKRAPFQRIVEIWNDLSRLNSMRMTEMRMVFHRVDAIPTAELMEMAKTAHFLEYDGLDFVLWRLWTSTALRADDLPLRLASYEEFIVRIVDRRADELGMSQGLRTAFARTVYPIYMNCNYTY